MTRLLTYLACLALGSQVVLAADKAECSTDKKCPQNKPCCSQYGECGTGAYCLGGCDPRSSFSIEACVPNPVCESKTYQFDDLKSVSPNTKYLGDAKKADWVSSGTPLSSDGNLLLTMPADSVGTLMANNHYMWYGKASAKLRTSRGRGVITAFILMSDVKDEIDFEFVGVDLETAQTNYYFQGVIDYTNGKNLTVPGGDTFGDEHEYEIDWTPDSITWSIDGKPLRTLDKKSTFDSKTNQYNFPQSPSRVQLSLWPGGKEDNGQGTIDWAGGVIDWEHEDIKKNGYFYSIFSEIKMECYDPPSGVEKKGDNSYVYTDKKGTEDTIQITDKKTVLKSLLASGLDMDKDYPSSSKSGSTPSETDISVIPGMKGGGAGTNGQQGGNPGDDGGLDEPTTDFTGPKDEGSPNTAPSQNERVFSGSIFAALVAVMVLVSM
ncbi:putative glycosidase crf2 [Onygenales sp. PD_40]|nr:putative glycosidase crf2 [Onygenales sp. PD_40]KAK2758141.1 putative glycosidase crf2 [Emmonsiellopsis sp. PD_33]KAK2806856.1 putative glycosidase crf2 [Onygenales sp. PD_10]